MLSKAFEKLPKKSNIIKELPLKSSKTVKKLQIIIS